MKTRTREKRPQSSRKTELGLLICGVVTAKSNININRSNHFWKIRSEQRLGLGPRPNNLFANCTNQPM